MTEKDLEEGIKVRKIALEHAVVHAPLAHRAPGHQKEVLDLVAQGAGQALGKVRVADIEKAVLFPAVRKDRDVRLRAEQPRGEEHGVRAAGDVHRAVVIAREDGPQQREHRVRVVDVRLEKDQLHPLAAPLEVGAHFLVERGAAGREFRADVHDPLRMEHFRSQYVFQRPPVKQLDQRFHAAHRSLPAVLSC